MKVSGTASLNATPEQVWAALNDPAVLVQTIPGCEQLETVGTDHYRMRVTAGVASIKGSYLGEVRLADHEPYSAFTLTASGAGAPGTLSADVKVTLDGRDDGTTLLSYDADAVVGGTIGGVGQRVLGGVAKKLAGEFFASVNAQLTAPAIPVPAATAAPTAASVGASDGAASSVPAAPAEATVFTRAVPAPAAGGLLGSGTSPLPAFVAGAVIALLGVLVGWRISRRS